MLVLLLYFFYDFFGIKNANTVGFMNVSDDVVFAFSLAQAFLNICTKGRIGQKFLLQENLQFFLFIFIDEKESQQAKNE